MKPVNRKKNYKKVLYILLAILCLVVAGVLVYKVIQNKNSPKSNDIQKNQESQGSIDSSIQPEQTSSNVQDTATPTKPSTPTSPPPVPKQPVLSKSSGNNGPVPSGVNIDFTCSAELNTECSIILLRNGNQTTLGPTKIIDKGNGQFFVSFYWTSIKGSYKVTAQAKNNQGGVSSSISQALEVQ